MDLMFAPFRKYVDFQGRARRSEYWLWVLFLVAVEVVLMVLAAMMNGGDPERFGPANILLLLFWLGTFLPTLAVAVRRLHDTDRSGWWLLIGLIPLIGGIVLLIFYVLDGTPGPNKFGPDPKGRGGDAEVFN
ncbi:MAG: DUF805 domain-containing protein [Caulobacter sp.]|nr:DUF805 domain-containing protein [Caulobacter sp.]